MVELIGIVLDVILGFSFILFFASLWYLIKVIRSGKDE